MSLIAVLLIQNAAAQHSASFSKDYQTTMRDSVTYEIPEVCELFHVVTALTPFGKGNTGIIDHSTDYHKEVIAYFEEYQDHPIVKKIQKELRRNRYNRLKMDACGFLFNATGEIIKDKTYPTLSFESKNWLEKYIKDLEDFSKKSKFQAFYQKHKEIYTKQIQLQKKQLAVKNHWDWLEQKFTSSYDSYRITFSPLVDGSHSANYFIDDDFKQSVMFIGPPYVTEKYTNKQLEGLAGRMVFTEIDHNYINPLSDNYLDEIKLLFTDLEQWNNMKYRDYSTALSTFNEYTTYMFYSLYVIDNYDEADAKLIIARCEKVMENRGFIQYAEFNQQALEFYSKNREASGKEIYEFLFFNTKN